VIGENEYADLVRGMTFEPSIPDLTHYMEAVSRLRKENADLRTQLTAEQAKVRELEYGKALLKKWCAGAEVEIDRLREGIYDIKNITNDYDAPIGRLMAANSLARSLLEVKDD